MNRTYSFDTFVVGETNRLAFLAARNAVQNPAVNNPLFIYGSSGVGKTHLIRAVESSACDLYGSQAVVFTTGEDLANEIVHACKEKKPVDFAKGHPAAKYMLVDDLHILAGKNATQNAFADLFCSLADRGLQIVITASLRPSELPILKERLKNDFSGCLMVDILSPNHEICREIALIKATQLGIEISDTDIEQIISASNGNVRSIEGKITKMKADRAFS